MGRFKKMRRNIRYTLVYALIRFLIFFSTVLSRKAWLRFCGALGLVAYYFAAKTRRLTIKNLSVVFTEKSPAEIKQLAKRTFKMLGKNAGDVLHSTTIKSVAEMDKIVVTHGLQNLAKAQAKGKGVIFLGSHLGAFDLQVTSMAMRGLEPHVIGTPLKDKRLNNLLWGHRNLHGAVAIQRGKETFKMLKVLKSGGSVALLIDQDTKVKSRFVDFFGMPAATPVGATILAMKTGAAVVPTYIHLGNDGKQYMQMLPEIPLKITGDDETDMVYNTQVFTNYIEGFIRKHPEQWVWMHERWKTKKGEEIL